MPCKREGRDGEDGAIPGVTAPLPVPVGAEMGGGPSRQRAGMMEGAGRFPRGPLNRVCTPGDS